MLVLGLGLELGLRFGIGIVSVSEFRYCTLGELDKPNTNADKVHQECRLALRRHGYNKSSLSTRCWIREGAFGFLLSNAHLLGNLLYSSLSFCQVFHFFVVERSLEENYVVNRH